MELVARDKSLWTKSIFSRTFPILQKLSKASRYPDWRTIFLRYPAGIISPVEEWHVGRIFHIFCRKGAGRKTGVLAPPLWAHGADFVHRDRGDTFCTFSAKTERNTDYHRERWGCHFCLLFLNLPSWVSLLEYFIFRQPLSPVRKHSQLWPLVHALSPCVKFCYCTSSFIRVL